ncbi:hypothetical protein ACQKND_16280 [Viridibacillus arvi]|uniref:hypothetical protein n=1 Tax=Viridibacillus arvi TaxID=263475 RepID=UPI003CFFF8CF
MKLDQESLNTVIDLQQIDFNNLTEVMKQSIVEVLNMFNKPLEDKLEDCSADLPYRICCQCDKVMNEGYLIESADTYCSEECLHQNISQEEYFELYDDGDGDSFWTTWEDNSIFRTPRKGER